MADANDMDLVREFARQNSEPAFAELVRRHLNLVYSVARRYTGHDGDAQDVAQAVFIILARKADRLSDRTVLTGWLYETTRHAASRLVRTHARRRANEQEATMQSTLDPAGDDPVWRQLVPHLEAAMSRLGERDRTLLALRFYENKTGAEAAALLGIREEAAQKRTARALEKLRKIFALRGVDSTTALLAGAISANSVSAAPAMLAKAVTAVAFAKGAAAGTSTLTLVKGALKIMAWTKAKTAAVVGTTVILVTLGVGYFDFFHKTHPNQPGKLKLPVGEISPAIGFGRTHGIILASDGSLWTWGENDLGWPALGLGNIQKTAFLNRIGNENDWQSIAVGESHNLALKQDGTVWGWGEDLYDQLANHTNYLRNTSRNKLNNNYSNLPIKSALGSDWKQIAAGSEDSFGIKNDDTLWAWGLNDFGQLGIGSFKDNPMPSRIGLSTWRKVYVGFINTAGIQSDGSLWVWGGGPSVGNTVPRSSKNYSAPIRITSDTNWMDLAVGENVIFAIKSDGTLWAWGYNSWIFTGTRGNNETLTKIGTDTDWQVCSCSGSQYLLLRKIDGSLWSFRPPDFGKLAQLKRITLQKDIVAFGAGSGLGAALTRDGEVWTWGKVIGEHLELSPNFTVFEKPWQLSNLEKLK